MDDDIIEKLDWLIMEILWFSYIYFIERERIG